MPLAESEVEARLAALPGWEFDDDEIKREYTFAGFREAIFFVNTIAGIAESMNHHPEIEISFNEVEIELKTHSEGGVTEKDLALAGLINEAADALGAETHMEEEDDEEDEDREGGEDASDAPALSEPAHEPAAGAALRPEQAPL